MVRDRVVKDRNDIIQGQGDLPKTHQFEAALQAPQTWSKDGPNGLLPHTRHPTSLRLMTSVSSNRQLMSRSGADTVPMTNPTHPSFLSPACMAELIRRHAAGERSLDLLNALNRAAFEYFHAPWETLPPPRSEASEHPQSRRRRPSAESLEESQDMPDRSEEVPTEDIPPSNRLGLVLDNLGLASYHRGTDEVLVLRDLTDLGATLRITFTTIAGGLRFRVRTGLDLQLGPASDDAVLAFQDRWNSRPSRVIARTNRVGNRGSMRLSSWSMLPGSAARPLECAHPSLLALLEDVSRFWHEAHRELAQG